MGYDDDLLIPSEGDIKGTFSSAQYTWARFVSRAKAAPLGHLPRGATDPVILLRDVPALPERLPLKRGLCGVPVWKTQTGGNIGVGEENVVHGLQKGVALLANGPLACPLSLIVPSSPSGHDSPRTSPGTARGLALLTLCWSYIVSARLLEMQNRPLRYPGPKSYLWPTRAEAYVSRPTDFVVDLRTPASPELVRWICAVLTPGRGWFIGKHPPAWTACACPSGHLRLVVLTDQPLQSEASGPLPSSLCPGH